MNRQELTQHVNIIQAQLEQLQQTIDQQSHSWNAAKPIFEQLFSCVQALRSTAASEGQQSNDPKTPDFSVSQASDANPSVFSPSSDAAIEQTLRASEEKWRALSVCSPVGIFTCDVQGRITYTNPRCQEIGGFTLQESLGEGFAEFIHSEDRDRIVSQWLATAKLGQQCAEEFRILTPEGTRWVHVRTAPILSDCGKLIGHTGTVEDVTKQKQAEEQIKTSLQEKEALLKEIHHRVKNNLQIISSLIYLQAQGIEDFRVQQIFEDSQSRISSMALVHDSLYRSQDLARINLSEYIQTLSTSLFHTYRIQADSVQLKVDVQEEVFVSLEKAIPCGLILNELITNALKHGFTDGRKGEITVKLEVTSESVIHLVVENDGSGLPATFELPTMRSMGLRLVHALVSQLQGQLEVDKTVKTRFKVTFDRS